MTISRQLLRWLGHSKPNIIYLDSSSGTPWSTSSTEGSTFRICLASVPDVSRDSSGFKDSVLAVKYSNKLFSMNKIGIYLLLSMHVVLAAFSCSKWSHILNKLLTLSVNSKISTYDEFKMILTSIWYMLTRRQTRSINIWKVGIND